MMYYNSMYYLKREELNLLSMWSTPRSLTSQNILSLLGMSLFKMLTVSVCSDNATGYTPMMAISSEVQDGYFTVLYFASASSYTSKDSESIEAPLPLSKLFDTLEEKYEGIKAKILESCLVTINLKYVDVSENAATDGSEKVIQQGDEVAIIPPVSSG